MELSDYFTPIDEQVVDFRRRDMHTLLGDSIAVHTAQSGLPDVGEGMVALMGVAEDRHSIDNPGCAAAPDHIRHYLYRLAHPCSELRLVDLGNIAPGATVDETYVAVADVVEELIARGVTIVMLGGGDDLVFPVYKGYEQLGRLINICSVDARFNLEGGDAVNSNNYLQHIILQQPNYLFDYVALGYQTYFVGEEMVQLMDELNFGARRLGEVQPAMEKAEPVLRHSDVVVADISCVRQSDAPANAEPSPHGFYGEQLCQIARYAGMSDQTSCFMLTEMNPVFDRGGQTAHMLAHALWYFLEGFHHRLGDLPHLNPDAYKRFTVPLDTEGVELVFLKSLLSDRWWMEVPCKDPERSRRYSSQTLVPCDYSDYQSALHNEIPDLWWHYFNRLNG